MSSGITDISIKAGLNAAEFRAATQRMMKDVQGIGRVMEPTNMSMRQMATESRRVWEETRTPFERYTRELTRLQILVRTGSIDQDTYNRAVGMARQHYTEAAAAAGRYGRVLGSLKSDLVGMARMYVGVYGAYRLLSSGIRETIEAQQAMASSLAIMGDVSDETRSRMHRLAYDVAYDTKFMAKEVMGAYYYLASAGLDVKRSMEAMPVVAKFAQAGMFDLSRATSLLTDAQSALGLKSKDAQVNMRNMTRIADMLVKANTLADASTEQFAEALAGPLAGALRANNRSLEEGVALLALMAERGEKGAEASHSAMVLYRDIPRAIAANRATWEAYHLDMLTAEGNMRSMADMVLELTNRLSSMSDVERAAAMDALGLTRSVRVVVMKLMEGTEELKNFEAELGNAAGTMDDVASKQLPQAWQGFHKFKVAVDELAESILDFPLSVLGEIAEKAADLARDRGGKPSAAETGLMGLGPAGTAVGLYKILRLVNQLIRAREAEQQLRAVEPLPTRPYAAGRARYAETLQIGLPAEVKPLGLTPEEQKRVTDAINSAREAIAALGVEIEQFGFSETAKEISDFRRALEDAGVASDDVAKLTEEFTRQKQALDELADAERRRLDIARETQRVGEEAAQAIARAQENDRKAAERRREALEQQGEAIKRNFETPMERATRLTKEAYELWSVGAISTETFRRAQESYWGSVLKGYEDELAAINEEIAAAKQPRHAAAMEVGGREWYSYMAGVHYRATAAPGQPSEKQKELIDKIEAVRKILEAIRDKEEVTVKLPRA